MKEFISQFPEVILSVLGLLMTIVGWGIRQSILKLNTTMTSIVDSNVRIDRRLIAVETTCNICRNSCQPREVNIIHSQEVAHG